MMGMTFYDDGLYEELDRKGTKMGPRDIAAAEEDTVARLAAHVVDARSAELLADLCAAKALLHYERGHWNEAQAAALTSVALRQAGT